MASLVSLTERYSQEGDENADTFSQMKLLDTFLYLISTTISESNSVVMMMMMMVIDDDDC